MALEEKSKAEVNDKPRMSDFSSNDERLSLYKLDQKYNPAIDSRLVDSKAVIRLLQHSDFVSVYGPTGVGKTAFLSTSLSPQLLISGYFPILVDLPRLRFLTSQNEDESLLNVIHEAIFSLVNECNGSDADELICKSIESHNMSDAVSVDNAVMSVWEYFQHGVNGWSSWFGVGRDKAFLQPVLIIDGVDELFREPPNAHLNKGSNDSASAWNHIVNQLTDLAEFRIPFEEIYQKYTSQSERSQFSSTPKYKTIFCFDEESLSLIGRVNVALPSVLRSKYRLSGFRYNQALKMLADTSELDSSYSEKLGRAALVLEAMDQAVPSDRRESNLERLNEMTTTRLLRQKLTPQLKAADDRVTGSEIALAKLMMESEHADGKFSGTIYKRKSIRSLRVLWGRFLRHCSFFLYIRNKLFGKPNISKYPKDSLKKYAPRVSRQLSKTKHRKLLRLFRDSNYELRKIRVTEAWNALASYPMSKYFPARFRHTVSESEFAEELDRNPLFQLSDSASGRTVGLVNPLVFRCVEFVANERLKRLLLWIVPLALFGSITSIQWTLDRSRAESLAINTGIYARDNWLVRVQANQDLSALGKILDAGDAGKVEDAWKLSRESDLKRWLENIDLSGNLDLPLVKQIIDEQYRIYSSESFEAAVLGYKKLENQLTLFIGGAGYCDSCKKFGYFVLDSSFEYLMLTYERLVLSDREVTELSLAEYAVYLRNQIHDMCERGTLRFSSSMPKQIFVTATRCVQLKKNR